MEYLFDDVLEIKNSKNQKAVENPDIHNTVALCPNCHRKMHSLCLEEDVNKLKQIVKI